MSDELSLVVSVEIRMPIAKEISSRQVRLGCQHKEKKRHDKPQ